MNPTKTFNDKQRVEPDMTPMVDVTFLLLIFFMVTASFSLQRAIAVPTPTSDRPSLSTQDEPENETASTRIGVDELGTFWVQSDQSWLEIVGKQNLIRRLRSQHATGDSHSVAEIMYHPDARLQHLIDATDAATTAGYEAVRILPDPFDL